MKNNSSAFAPQLVPPPDPWMRQLADLVAETVVRRIEQSEHPRLLTPAEAGKYLGRSARWIRQQVQLGNLLPVEGSPKQRPRFDRAALDRWIERG